MSTCHMMILTILGLPLALFGLGNLFFALRSAVTRWRLSSPTRSGRARHVPVFVVAMFAAAMVVGLGYGWKTSHPCQEASAASTSKLPQAFACLAR